MTRFLFVWSQGPKQALFTGTVKPFIFSRFHHLFKILQHFKSSIWNKFFLYSFVFTVNFNFFFFLVKKYMLSTTYSPYHRLLILCLVYNPDRYFWSSLLNFNLQFNFVVHLTFIFPWKFWPSFFIMHSAVFFTSRNLFGVPFKAM